MRLGAVSTTMSATSRYSGSRSPVEQCVFQRVGVPARPRLVAVLMQDFTGVPCVVDLAAMRDAMTKPGGDAQKINPLVPCHLVIDHSVMVDQFGGPGAFQKNVDLEYERDSHAGTAFDLLVGIVEGLAQLGGELPAHRGLSGPHQADEKYVIRDVHTGILAVHTCPRVHNNPACAAWLGTNRKSRSPGYWAAKKSFSVSLSAYREAIVGDARRDEYQQLSLVVMLGVILE